MSVLQSREVHASIGHASDRPARRVISRVACALLGHDFTAGIAGLVLRTDRCRRCDASASH